MPRDPFADDPNDPASFLEPDEPMEPLTEAEKDEVRDELTQITEFQRILSPLGIAGLLNVCEDCGEEHYYDWEILKSHLNALLAGEYTPVHEPSADPDPHAYAPWDYCLGFVAGLQYGSHPFGSSPHPWE